MISMNRKLLRNTRATQLPASDFICSDTGSRYLCTSTAMARNKTLRESVNHLCVSVSSAAFGLGGQAKSGENTTGVE